MPTEPAPIGDLAATVKSREVQRAMFAEMAGDHAAAARHFLAAAHLELVLAEDYLANNAGDLALRSQLSAASSFWRAGQTAQAQAIFDGLLRSHPQEAIHIQQVMAELRQAFSARAS